MDTAPPPVHPGLPVRYFDGRSSRPREVQAALADGQLHLTGPDVDRVVEARRVQWPERTRRGPRIAQLPGGGSIQTDDAAAWDAWVRGAGHGESVVVRLQQSWRGVLVSLFLLVAVTAAGYVWGLPWAARAVADRFPDGVEQQIGDTVLDQVDDFVKPSQLSAQEQQAIEQAWQQALRAHTAAQAARGVVVRPSRLLIRHSEDIGPNALALPGGTMLLTDDMARLLQHDTDVIAGVLAHELGHVQHRHGVRMLVQVGVLGFVTSTLWGDYSGVLATVPLWLGQAHYSREAEREADAYSVTVLRDAGLSPAVMTRLFERFALFKRCGDEVLKPAPAGSASACKTEPGTGADDDDEEKHGFWGLGFASHPADEDRIAFFRDAAR
ncbi:M48 family metallopeptidase [Hydrogenophaga pseudoflava]|uniref:M48 family metallopeptidase n=1 Tax=Hydrogenophaga pseudoflava TaxID=47421 RepID=UPI0027E4D23A|nr:M48 family metallopeptidase [Hydrogenophaga pseudoflava]MDQ7746836.1 M48 family metallopeptidase [Hydrogenophaga pseudoflava]